MKYQVKLDIFEGPLDLLLYLIKKNDLNIHDIKISDITNEYLEYINLIKLMNIELAGDFIVMAATLMRIKSKSLLPDHGIVEEDEQEEYNEDTLKMRLIEYQKFKEAANDLKVYEQNQSDYFYRETVSFDKENMDYEVTSTIFDLVEAFKFACSKFQEKTEKEIFAETVTVEEKMEFIMNTLSEQDYINVSELFDTFTKIELIVTFLALLELIKLKKVSVMQTGSYQNIRIYKVQYESEQIIDENKEFVKV
ncbi:segregation and condensation protein A [bacterium]